MNILNKKNHPKPNLPERILQFGTGVLLRGLPNYLMDKANKQGIFNGQAVVVKSTSSDTSDFDKQDCLYTLVEKGILNGQVIENEIVIEAISRVVNANSEWENVLKCAENPDMQVVISNTTEVGLQYVAEDIFASPPQSFPAKLTAFLYARYRHFNGSEASGMTVIPTELIVDNGKILRGFVLQHAEANELSEGFSTWLNDACDFCSSLVDRIVPGALCADDRAKLQYEDNLAIQAEPFLLWAVEGGKRVRERLSFHKTDSRLVIAEDITPFREQKLRILNGGHTISVPLAYLSGERTVVDMMEHPLLGRFVEQVILTEILPTLDGICDNAEPFAHDVISRFKNPFIQHKLLSITVQCSSKMQSRNALTFQRYYDKMGHMPPLMSLGFAAYLWFSRPTTVENKAYFGTNTEGGKAYPIQDDKASILHEHWSIVKDFDKASLDTFVSKIMADNRLFEESLQHIPNFNATIATCLSSIIEQGTLASIEKLQRIPA
jgi:tagaturonate reductase